MMTSLSHKKYVKELLEGFDMDGLKVTITPTSPSMKKTNNKSGISLDERELEV